MHLVEDPIRVLLLDDDPENLLLRAAILRKHGYLTDTASTIGKPRSCSTRSISLCSTTTWERGSSVPMWPPILRSRRPEVPIIILSATLERRFGGVEDMHLLKGYSSVDDLITALRSFEAKHRGKPVVVDARDFFYSRIAMAIGEDVVLEILDRDGQVDVRERVLRPFAGAAAGLVSREEHVCRDAGSGG